MNIGVMLAQNPMAKVDQPHFIHKPNFDANWMKTLHHIMKGINYDVCYQKIPSLPTRRTLAIHS